VQYIPIRKIRHSEARRVPAERRPFQAARELKDSRRTAGYCPTLGRGEIGSSFGGPDRDRAGDPGRAEERAGDRAGGEDAVRVRTGGGGRFKNQAGRQWK